MAGRQACGDDWKLIWCHERCHKPENDTHRQAMSDAALESGGSAMCFKKAKQLGRWISNRQMPELVLVTDWREAQPAAAELAQSGGGEELRMMVVLCDCQSQLKKAAAWVRLADLQDSVREKIRVVDADAIPQDLMGGLISRCFARAGARAGCYESEAETVAETSCGGSGPASEGSCWSSEGPPSPSRSASPMSVRGLPHAPPPGLSLPEVMYIEGPFHWAREMSLGSVC